jgi:hypothetical protein
VHIAEPKGNIQRGRFARSENLIHALEELMESRDKRQRDEILKGVRKRMNKLRTRRRRRRKHPRDRKARKPSLQGLLPAGTLLKATYKKQVYSAEVDNAGRVWFNNEAFNSPSAAGAFVRGGKATDGWMFWTYQNEDGKWVMIDELRKQGANASKAK